MTEAHKIEKVEKFEMIKASLGDDPGFNKKGKAK